MSGSQHPCITRQLRITDLQFAFGPSSQECEALFDGFNLQVDAGRITTLLGRSGVGKTSLLNLIAGTLQPQKGSIRVENLSPSQKKALIGMVFQSPTLIPWRNVLSNALFGIELIEGRVTPQAKEAAEGYLTRCGLGERLFLLPHQLSGGMQQRVSLVRSLLVQPDMLLLDEPFSNLDFDARFKLQIEMSDMIDEHNSIVVFVTHDIEDALRFGDRIILLGGKPIQILDDFEICEPRRERLESDAFDASDFSEYKARIRAAWRRSENKYS